MVILYACPCCTSWPFMFCVVTVTVSLGVGSPPLVMVSEAGRESSELGSSGFKLSVCSPTAAIFSPSSFDPTSVAKAKSASSFLRVVYAHAWGDDKYCALICGRGRGRFAEMQIWEKQKRKQRRMKSIGTVSLQWLTWATDPEIPEPRLAGTFSLAYSSRELLVLLIPAEPWDRKGM